MEIAAKDRYKTEGQAEGPSVVVTFKVTLVTPEAAAN